MIRSSGIDNKMRRQRADAKTLDNLFRRRIEAGANCSRFVSNAIWDWYHSGFFSRVPTRRRLQPALCISDPR